MELTDRQTKLLIACFQQNNGGEFDPIKAGATIGFTKDESNDLCSILKGDGFFSVMGLGDRSFFTTRGKEVAREMISRTDIILAAFKKKLDAENPKEIFVECRIDPHFRGKSMISSKPPIKKIGGLLSVLNAFISHNIISGLIVVIVGGFLCILIFNRWGFNLMDPSSSKTSSTSCQLRKRQWALLGFWERF